MAKRKPKVRRDKYGRFAPKRRNVKLKPYTPPNRASLGRFAPRRVEAKPKRKTFKRRHWKVLQEAKWIEVSAYGYYIVVRAMVPGGWSTGSTPAWITAAPEESLHQIVWRTKVRQNLFRVTESSLLADLREEGVSLAKAQLVQAQRTSKEIIVLSCELRVLIGPMDSFQVDVWEGITPPKWLRNVK